MASPRDNKKPDEPEDEAELEQREYSSPPCYVHEFEPPASGAEPTRKVPKPAPEAAKERK